MTKTFFAGCIFLFCVFIGCALSGGCNKTTSPFGVNAPNGLDIPSLTPTPISGSIVVYVEVNGADQSGITVRLTDPHSSSVTVVTQSSPGVFASYTPAYLIPGNWQAQVLKQGQYGLSAIDFNVSSAGQQTVTFIAGGQSISTSPVSQTYNYATGFYYVYDVNYNQPGNLDIPVAVNLNSLQNAWTASSLPVLNASSNNSPVTIIHEICSVTDQPLTFTGVNGFGTPVPTPGITILHKAFPIAFWMTWDCGINCGTLDIHSNNDCSYSWPVTVSQNGNPIFTGPVKNGQTISASYINSGDWCTVDGTAPNGQHFSDYRPCSGFLSGGVTLSYYFTF